MNKRLLWFLLLPLLLRPFFVFMINWIPELEFVASKFSIGQRLSYLSLALTITFILLHDKKTFPPRPSIRMVLLLKSFHALCNGALFFLLLHQEMGLVNASKDAPKPVWEYIRLAGIHFLLDASLHSVISAVLSVFIIMAALKNTRISAAKVFIVSVLQFIPILEVFPLFLIQKHVSDDGSEPTLTNAEPLPPVRKRPMLWLILRFSLLIPSFLSTLFVVRVVISFYKDHPYNLSYELAFLALAALCNFLFTLSAINDKNAVATLSWSNFVIRLFQLPANIINIVVAIFFLFTVFLGPVALAIVAYSLLCLVPSAIIGLGLMLSAVKNDYLSPKPAILLNTFHWIPGLDFAFSFVMAIYMQVMIIRRKTAPIKAESALLNLHAEATSSPNDS